jgi:hypothetical protein
MFWHIFRRLGHVLRLLHWCEKKNSSVKGSTARYELEAIGRAEASSLYTIAKRQKVAIRSTCLQKLRAEKF